MKTSFEQHADGLIILRQGGQDYLEKDADFKSDSGMQIPGLPSKYTGRVYEPGVRHHLTNDERADPAPEGLEWPEGDAIIAAWGNIITGRDARIAPPTPSLSEYKEDARNAIKAMAMVKVNNFDTDFNKADVRAVANPFITQVGSATSKTQVDTRKANALAAIEAL